MANLFEAITHACAQTAQQIKEYISGDQLPGLVQNALPAWAKGSVKPTYTKGEVGLDKVDNVRQYSAENPPPYPVTSVDGKTGEVSTGINYSTEEIDTGDKWIDGRSIYRKTLIIEITTKGQDPNTVGLVSNDADLIFPESIIFVTGDANSTIFLPGSISTQSARQFYCLIQAKSVKVASTSNTGIVYATVRYIKAAD